MRAAILAALLVSAAALVGCGGAGEEPAAEPTTTEAAPATEAQTTAEAETEAPPTIEARETAPGTTGLQPCCAETQEEEPPPPPLEPGLPDFIAGYEGWPKLNAAPIPVNPEGDAHLGVKEVFASQQAGSNGVYPDGTVIVKEGVRPDTDFVGLVAIMRKEAGADPAHNDWVFVEYTRESRDAAYGLQAEGEVCWSCHMGAAETDYVWIATLGLTR